MESGTAAPPKDPVPRGAISISSNQHEEITIPPCKRLESSRRLELIFNLPSPFFELFPCRYTFSDAPSLLLFLRSPDQHNFFLGRVFEGLSGRATLCFTLPLLPTFTFLRTLGTYITYISTCSPSFGNPPFSIVHI